MSFLDNIRTCEVRREATAVVGLPAHHPPPRAKTHTTESEGKNSRFLANLFSMSPTQSSAFTNLS